MATPHCGGGEGNLLMFSWWRRSRGLRQDGSSLSAIVAGTCDQNKSNIRALRRWASTKQIKVCWNSLFTRLIWTGQNERSARGDSEKHWGVTKWWGQHQFRKLTHIVQQKRCSRNVLVNGFCLRKFRGGRTQGSGLCLVHTLCVRHWGQISWWR